MLIGFFCFLQPNVSPRIHLCMASTEPREGGQLIFHKNFSHIGHVRAQAYESLQLWMLQWKKTGCRSLLGDAKALRKRFWTGYILVLPDQHPLLLVIALQFSFGNDLLSHSLIWLDTWLQFDQSEQALHLQSTVTSFSLSSLMVAFA